MSSIMKGLIGEVGSSSAEDFMHRLKSTMKVNPKGSASEKMVLQRYIMTPMVQDMNLSGKDWIVQAAKWLQGNKEKLEQKFPDLDLSDIVGLAEKMYEDFLAMQGQLEEECGVGYELNPAVEEGKAELRSELDQAIRDFLDKGGQIEKIPPNKVRAKPGMSLASKHIGTAGEIGRKVRSKMLVGKGRNIQGNKPVVNIEETHSTGTTIGSAGIGGGAGLGIDKSPIEKVIEKPMGESDISGLLAASRLNKSFIITAQTSEGQKKKFRVKAQSENVAKEKFSQHYSKAKILDVKEEPVDEGQLPPKAGFNKNPHKVGPGTSKDDYEYKKFIPRDRKEKGEEWAIARDVKNVNSKLGKKKPKELDTGFYKNYLGNRPVREEDLEEANPNQQMALYNPSGTTYKGQPMPKMEPDPVDKAKPLSRAKNVPADLSDIDDEIRQKQLKNKLNDIIDNDPGFSDIERFLIKAYWLDGKTFDQLAKETNLRAALVNQIVRRAERKLRHPERAKHLKPFLLADGQIYSTGAGAGQSYRKFTPKPAGVAEGGFFDYDKPEIGDMVKHRNGMTGKVKKIGTQGDQTLVYFKDKNGEMNFGLWKKHVFPVEKADVAEEQAPMFTPEEKVNELRRETINQYLGRQSALVRGGLRKEPSKTNPVTGKEVPPSWKVAAAKIAKPGSDIERYAKVKVSNEEKIVNMNDPGSDGWRVYKVKPAGAKESAIMKGIQRESK